MRVYWQYHHAHHVFIKHSLTSITTSAEKREIARSHEDIADFLSKLGFVLFKFTEKKPRLWVSCQIQHCVIAFLKLDAMPTDI